jgi:putative membrane protein
MKTLTLAIALLVPMPCTAAAAEMQPQEFATKAAISDMFEIEAAKIEIQNGKSEKIKAFAEEMVKDHSGSTHNLMDAAARTG